MTVDFVEPLRQLLSAFGRVVEVLHRHPSPPCSRGEHESSRDCRWVPERCPYRLAQQLSPHPCAVIPVMPEHQEPSRRQRRQPSRSLVLIVGEQFAIEDLPGGLDRSRGGDRWRCVGSGAGHEPPGSSSRLMDVIGDCHLRGRSWCGSSPAGRTRTPPSGRRAPAVPPRPTAARSARPATLPADARRK